MSVRYVEDLLDKRGGKRRNVDAWLERFFKMRLSLSSPASPNLERFYVFSRDSSGERFNAPSGLEVPCKDDSGAHNAAHRADRKFADYGADLMIWAALTEEQRRIFELQHSPVMCAGEGKKPRRERSDDPMRDSADPKTRCPGCARPVVAAMIRLDGTIKGHVLFVPIAIERRTASYVRGDGIHIDNHVRDADGELTDYSRMLDWQPVRLNYERIGELTGLTTWQVQRRVRDGRAKIAERLLDD